VSVADLGLEWDSDFATGCTQPQAESMFSIVSGSLRVNSNDAVTAGADADFSARWYLSGLVEHLVAWSGRIQRIATGSGANNSDWFAFRVIPIDTSTGLVSAPTGKAGTNTGLFFGASSTAFNIGSNFYETTPSNFTLRSDFVEYDMSFKDYAENSSSGGGLIKYDTGTSYAGSTSASTIIDSGSYDFADTDKARIAIEIVHSAASTNQFELDIPRGRILAPLA